MKTRFIVLTIALSLSFQAIVAGERIFESHGNVTANQLQQICGASASDEDLMLCSFYLSGYIDGYVRALKMPLSDSENEHRKNCLLTAEAFRWMILRWKEESSIDLAMTRTVFLTCIKKEFYEK